MFETHRDSTFLYSHPLSMSWVSKGGSGGFFSDAYQVCKRQPNYFKGMDNPAKLKSVNNISLIWIEECSEVKYEGFKELIGRLRHPYHRLYMMLTTNPVSQSNWTYRHFSRMSGTSGSFG
ncbi:phage terminase large subunit [Bacillus licheniformis]|nr:phage terminase large subunit [Bacillus licheniformis]